MEDLDLAVELADIADALTHAAFLDARVNTARKADGSLVSEVDVEVERHLRDHLRRNRPFDQVLGEEGPNQPAGRGDSHRTWIIDPIDHTNNFVRGIPVFATLIALRIDDAIDVGVVSAPALGHRWRATRGDGAYREDGNVLQVSQVDNLGEAHLSFAALDRWAERGMADGLLELTRRCRFAFGSGGFWNHMLVAEGRLEASLDPWGEIWDLAAVQVIATEAGGNLTDLDGRTHPGGGCAIVTTVCCIGRCSTCSPIHARVSMSR